MKKTAVIIGRWQILHAGHQTLLDRALELADEVVVVIGSAIRSRNTTNPFTWLERKEMFLAATSPADRLRLKFLPVRDYGNDTAWVKAVREGVEALATGTPMLIGFKKDDTSYYLEHFPCWQRIDVKQERFIDATALRKVYFEADTNPAAFNVLTSTTHEGVTAWLRAWADAPAYRECRAEHQRVKAYQEKWTAPFYLTADAVVTAAFQGEQHVLLVKRKAGTIGEGLWATPGGFVEKRERFLEAAIRELQEETRLALAANVIKQSLVANEVFDQPGRSARGRIVSQAFHFDLGEVAQLPLVQGSDDVDEAAWWPTAKLTEIEEALFEDHACILSAFGCLKR